MKHSISVSNLDFQGWMTREQEESFCASLVVISYRGCIWAWARPGWRHPSKALPDMVLSALARPGGFPGSGVVPCGFSRVGAPDFTSPFSCCSQPPHPPLCNLWELKLLRLRFPTQDLSKLLPLKTSADQPYTSGASGPTESFP